MDKLFKVKTLAATPNPQQVIYAALHQDYSEHFVYSEFAWNESQVFYSDKSYGNDRLPSESASGRAAINALLKGGRGHFGCLEHPQITFAVGYFPHSVIQQARTHRIGVSFDCQSMRYTGKRLVEWVQSGSSEQIEELIYFRPVGTYTNRQGKKYEYTEKWRQEDLEYAKAALYKYAADYNSGMSEEHARGTLPFDYRQHFVVSFNVRSLMHFLDLRAKADAQLEIQWLCDLMLPEFKNWCPQIANWYEENRWKKARLAP